MKTIKFSIIILLAAATAFAQKETPPEGGTPRDFQLPAKKVSSLENGLNSTMVQYGAIPKATVRLIIWTGNIHEQENQVWLADIMGDLLEEGTTTKDAQTIADAMANMGGNLNINVGQNQTTINGSVLAEFAPDAVRLFADIIRNPAFPESELERLKNDRKRQLSVQKTQPQPLAQEAFRKKVYGDHAYGRFFPTEEMIDAYTIDDVKAFYNDNFGAKRTTVYVVGMFDENSVSEAITESFNDWQSGPEREFPEANPVTNQEIDVLDRPDAPQSTIVIGLPVVDPSHPDYLALQVTNALLGGSFSSRITSNIREDKGYTYSPFSTVNTGKGAAIWYEQADVTTEHTGASLREIVGEINKLQEEPPSAEELEGIQNYQAGIFVLQNSSRGGIINQLSFLDLHDLPENYLTDQVKNIHALTPEMIQEMAQKYIRDEEMTLVIVGDKKVLESQIAEYEAALKKL